MLGREISFRDGGSEASATWKNKMVKVLQKKTAGPLVKRLSATVTMAETVNACQRRSLHSALEPDWKPKDCGK